MKILSKIKSSTIIIIVLTITAIVFSHTLFFDFIIWDDPEYLHFPIPLSNIFNSFYIGNYQPITLLSFKIDEFLFGESSLFSHLFNLVLHLAVTLLVFIISKRLCENNFGAFICSLLFGIHPMHIESIAWVSGRKDILYSLFLLLALWQYLQYIKTAKLTNLGICFILYILSLLSKGQAVTFPLILIIIDIFYKRNLINKRIITEKIPFFIFSLFFGYIAIVAQSSEGELFLLSEYDLIDRIILSFHNYSYYFLKLILPFNLSAFTPFPLKINNSIPLLYYLYLLIIPLIIYFLILTYKKSKILFFGLLFFSFNIIFLLQILPVGESLVSDRYTYLSSLGIIIIISYLLSQLKLINIKLTILIVCIYFTYLITYTIQRTSVWKNSELLFSDIISKFPDSEIAYNSRAAYFIINNQYNEAIIDLNKAIQIDSKYADAYYNRSLAYYYKKDYKSTLTDCDKVLKIRPEYLKATLVKADTYKAQMLYKEAISNYSLVINIDDNNYKALLNRAVCYGNISNFDTAINDLNKSISINATSEAYYYLGLAKFEIGKNGCDDLQKSANLGNNMAVKSLELYCH